MGDGQNTNRDALMAELSPRAIGIGIVIGILFGAANAYLGLRVGLTVSASIPAAVMAVAIFHALRNAGLSEDSTILENNMVQTIGSAGESLAAGVIFTVPALILLGYSPGLLKIFVLGAIGGILGILFMAPLRRYLIVREHGNLVFPEGTACASVLVAGREGGAQGRLVFTGLGVGALFEFLMSGLGLWKAAPKWELPNLPAAEVSADSSPALLGVGYVIGPRIAAIMFGGGALAWLVLIPAIKLFGGSSTIYPGPGPVSGLDAHGIWHYYVRYIGAGAVVFGGIVTLVRSFPVIGSSAAAVIRGFRSSGGEKGPVGRTDQGLRGPVVAAGVVVLFLAMALLPRSMAPGGFAAALLALIFCFFFVAVSSRIVGLIGSSSNPVSGMTIAALLATTLVFKLLGWTGAEHQVAALAVGSIVCIGAAIAGDTSQDLKTGFLVRATPRLQQMGEVIGVLTSAAVIGIVVLRLHGAYGIGSEALPAPQATLMSLVVKGVLSGDLPWTLVFIGVIAAAVVELLGIPSLPFAVGLYLPLSLSTPILIGGLIRALMERKSKAAEGKEGGADKSLVSDRGVLFASGLIAGSAFVGMALGLVRSFGEGRGKFMVRALEKITVGPEWAGSWQDPAAAAALLVLAGVLLVIAFRNRNLY